jgi:hypothetical protein
VLDAHGDESVIAATRAKVEQICRRLTVYG